MANIQYYDVILKPVITEKSMEMMADKKEAGEFRIHFPGTHRCYKISDQRSC